MALDKFTFKNCFIFLMSLQTITASFICVTVMVDRLLYFFATLMLGVVGNSLLSYNMAVTAKLFGKTHVSTNYGLAMTSNITLNIIAIFAIDRVIETLGWHFTFIASGFLSLFSLIICI